jgi:hypothetical protein
MYARPVNASNNGAGEDTFDISGVHEAQRGPSVR